MKIFPKSITEKIWREHLATYSRTLIDYVSDIKKIIPIQFYNLLPSRVSICPLCLKNYFVATETGIDGNTEFSLDHLPPQSAGGAYVMITCKKCNNESGIFESELKKILGFGINKINPEAGVSFEVYARDTQTDKTIKGHLYNINGRTDIVFDETLKKYRQDYIDFLAKLNSSSMKNIAIDVPLYDIRKLERALLKSAYLLCFYWWGYEFAFSENGSAIRDVINGKKRYPCQVPVRWFENDDLQPTGISILREGEKRLAFVVNIKLKGPKVETTASMIIPSPTIDGWENIALLGEVAKSKQITEFNCVAIPRIIHRIGYTISWNIVFDSKYL